MSRMSRQKGAAAEREVARLLRLVFPDAKRRCAGDEARDVTTGRDLVETPGFCIQVECSATPRPLVKLSEARRAAVYPEIPVAIVRQSSRVASTGWSAVITIDDLLYLLKLEQKFVESYPMRADELRTEIEKALHPEDEEEPCPTPTC